MRTQFKVPAKLLLIAAISVLTILTMSGLALAQTETDPGGERFEIIAERGNDAYFSILDESECDDDDEYCTVKVTWSMANTGDSKPGDSAEWAKNFNTHCGSGTTRS